MLTRRKTGGLRGAAHRVLGRIISVLLTEWLAIPLAGDAVLSAGNRTGKINPGEHGWAPEAPAMHGFFVACGPYITPGLSTGPLKTMDIHPLMLAIIGLRDPAPTDGDASKLADFLYTERSNQSCLTQ